MQLTDNAKFILEQRYLMTKDDGKVESPEELFSRVAHHIARAELKYNSDKDKAREMQQRFYDAMINLEFLPNTPCLINAGRKLGQLSACFVLDVDDTLESIFEAAKQTAVIFKTGGGVGINFSKLRPKNTRIKKTNGVSSGTCSFMHIFDEVAERVKQGGVRRGAFIAILNCDHPEILDFIVAKNQEGVLSNFNTSVAITDNFIDNLEKDTILTHVEGGGRTVKTREIWNAIIEQAWKNGEPGVIFIDRINDDNPLMKVGTITATNPCGEIPLLPFESCNLGSLNLVKFISNDKKDVDWKKLETYVQLSVRFLDDMLDMNTFPIPIIEQASMANRKIGLGIMGWADLLLLLGISYSSKTATRLAEKLMSFIKTTAFETSKGLGEERGSFPNFELSTYVKKGKNFKLRNARLTAIAPTGSLSAIANVSSGIEPNFAWEYEAHRLGTVLKERHWLAKTYFDENKKLPDYYVTARDISPESHIKMQATFQKYVDSGISKTVNLPNTATTKDIEKIYLLAHDLGCKGITVYREGSRKYEMLSRGPSAAERIVVKPRPRPKRLSGTSDEMHSGCGKFYITTNVDDGKLPFEVFTKGESSGGCPAQSDAVGRLISLALRCNIDINEIVGQLKHVKCPSAMARSKECNSCPDGIGRILAKYCEVDDGKVRCPTCGTIMQVSEGCITCHSCGFTKCNG